MHERREQYEQDRLGNVRRKIDRLRAQEGNVGGSDDEGLVQIQSADAGSDVLLYSLPTHAQQAIVTQVWGFNSTPTNSDTMQLLEVDLDDSNSITSSTERSVPIQVNSGETRKEDYEGLPFDKAIGVNAEFSGQVGVALISDHHEEVEPASEQSEAP